MKVIIKWLWILLLLLPVAGSVWLLGDDWPVFLAWWLALSAIGWLAWPLAARLFPGGDAGYLLAKPLGLALATFMLWTFSYLHLLPFRRWTILLILAAIGAIAWLFKNGWRQLPSPAHEPGQLRRIVAGELLFGSGLLLWTFARGLKPELDSLEKFMNIGFMNSLWRTDYLPALDMWAAGGHINYYYYGQYVYTFLAKLTGIRPEVAYNLGMAATLALTLALGYAVGSRLLGLFRQKDNPLKAGWQTAGGLIAAFLVTFAGNSHAFFYGDRAPGRALLQWAVAHGWAGGSADNPFWFADSTRFIGYNPDTADKTIHEFPFYSFLVADLHAHVINLAFVLLFLAVLIGLVNRQRLLQAAADSRRTQDSFQASDDRSWHRAETSQVLRRFKTTATDGYLYLAGGLLALFMMGNYWDFAIYFAVAAVVLLLLNTRGHGRLMRLAGLPVFGLQAVLLLVPFLTVGNPVAAVFIYGLALVVIHYLTLINGDALTLTGAQLSWLFFLAHVLALPFNLAFEPISKSIALAVNHTPLWQLLILWGPHVLAGAILLFYILSRAAGRRGSRNVFPPPPEQREAAIQGNSRLESFIRTQNPADLLALGLFICAVGLILLPELLYVVDIYSGDYKRSNTMFKFTYQAFVLLSLVWAYAIARIAGHRRDRRARLTAGVLALLLLMPGWYPLIAASQWLGPFTRDRYQGLNGLNLFAAKDSARIAGENPAELAPDVAAIRWFNTEVAGQPVILESYGESYTDYCRISAFTGLPTVVGWETHEWLWRTSKADPNAYGSFVVPRQEDVRTLYTTSDQVVRQALLEKYRIDYVIIGKLERQRFTDDTAGENSPTLVQEDLLRQLGTVVFSQQDLIVLKINRPAS